MMAARSAFAVLLIILVLGGALVEAAGRPFDSSTKASSLNNLDDTEAIDEESPTIPTTEDVDEDLLAIPTTQAVDEEMATIPTLEDIMDEDLVPTPASEDEHLITIPVLEDTHDECVAIPDFLCEYVSTLDREMIHRYEAALESNDAFDDDVIAKDEVGEMYESLGDEGQSVTFDEKDIRKNRELVFPERLKESIYPSSLFLPHALATKIPFSRKKFLELMDTLHVSHKSKLATIMSRTISRCELTKQKYSKETTLTKEKEKKKKKKGSKVVTKEKKIVKEIEFNGGEFGKAFEEKEIEVKKGKSIGDKEIKAKEVQKRETQWKKDEFKKFLKKEVEKKERKGQKKKLVKEKELKKRGHRETKAKEEKFKEFKEKEFETFELEGKKERLSKENETKKKLFDKEGKHKEEEKHKYREYEVKEFKGKEVEKKGLKGKEDKGKEFKVKKPKDKEFEVKKYNLKKEKVYKDKDIVIEKKKLSKETLKCVISLEDMTDFVKKKFPAAKALETTSFNKHGDFKKIQWKVSEVKKHEKAVVCKKELFPFAVFKCKIVDKSKGVRIYYIKLEGKDGVHRKEVVACEDEKKLLKSELSKAKTKVLCRWITKSLIWVPKI